MKPARNIEIADIIASRLVGEITPQQQEILDNWLAERPEHGQWYAKLAENDYLSAGMERHHSFPIDYDKRRILARVRERRRESMGRVRIAAAAAFFLVLTTGLWLTLRSGGGSQATGRADEQVAILSIGDGKSFMLKENGVIEDGDLRMMNRDGSLSYEDTEKGSSVPALHTLTVPRGNRYGLVLPDGTSVQMNADSRLSFPPVFAEAFREVYLRGEAFFNVTPSDKPFVVHGGRMIVTVTGTSFNVRAYEDEDVTETTLVTGEVVASLGDIPGTDVTLRPGQQARVGATGTSLEIRDVDAASHTSWVNDVFVFDREAVSSIMRILSRRYDVDIVIASPRIAGKLYYGIIDMQGGVTGILDMMKKTGHIDYKKHDGTFIVYNPDDEFSDADNV